MAEGDTGTLDETQMMPGSALTAAELCQRLKVDRATLAELVARDQILQLVESDGRMGFPTFQVSATGTLLPGLAEVIAELADAVDDPFVWRDWLCAPASASDGRPRWRLLREGLVDPVVRSAGRSAWVWRK